MAVVVDLPEVPAIAMVRLLSQMAANKSARKIMGMFNV
jgi:hypothetical protein